LAFAPVGDLVAVVGGLVAKVGQPDPLVRDEPDLGHVHHHDVGVARLDQLVKRPAELGIHREVDDTGKDKSNG
jgi:hypothetical protein